MIKLPTTIQKDDQTFPTEASEAFLVRERSIWSSLDLDAGPQNLISQKRHVDHNQGVEENLVVFLFHKLLRSRVWTPVISNLACKRP